jgi:DNA-binding FadR family transcriptional regulator
MASRDREALERVSRAEALARQLEHDIVEKVIEPGERIGTKEDLRRRFRVAVATVNEAVRLLETRGLVHARPGPGGGVFVTGPSTRVRLNHLVLGFKWDDAPFADLLTVRNALEPVVWENAAEHRRAQDVRDLERILQRMEAEAGSPRAYLELNWTLHRRIAAMCRNAPLQSLYLTLLDYMEDALQDVVPDGFEAEENLAVHRRLVAAIASGDAEEIALALAAHEPVAQSLVPTS